MPTMNVSLPAEFARFVEEQVASGEYGTASEVVRDALRLLRRERSVQAEKLEILRREVGIGMAQAHAGQVSSRSLDDIAEAVRQADKRSDRAGCTTG